jgi:aldehyde:ferredoxin oxidoreductase
MTLGAFTGRMAMVDLTDRTTSIEPLDPHLPRDYVGSTGINTRLLADLGGRPDLTWRDPENPVIVGVGPMVGTLLPGASRTSATTLSPITGGYGHSNSGSFGDKLKLAGFDHVVVTGRADEPVVVVLDHGEIHIDSARDEWGHDTYDATDMIHDRYPGSSIACIGPAGENGNVSATLLTDKHGAFGSSGVGGVMGVKNLKALVARGDHAVGVADQSTLTRHCLRAFRDLMAQPFIEEWRKWGTLIVYRDDNPAGRERLIEDYGFDIDTWFELYESRVWEGPATCPGCPVGCKAKIRNEDHTIQISCPTGSMTNVFAIQLQVEPRRYRDIVKNTELANRLGVSTMWSSELIMWVLDLRDRGILSEADFGFDARWGDPATAERLLTDIAHRRGLGDVLAGPVPEAQRQIGGGAENDPVRKGRLLGYAEQTHLELGRWNGFSFGRVVDPRGPVAETAYSSIAWIPERTEDQLRRYCDRIGVPPDRVDQVLTGGTDGYDLARFTRYIERYNMVIYSIGQCNRPYFSRVLDSDALASIMTAATGLTHTPESILEAGDRMITLQRLLNAAHGLDAVDDLGPEHEIDTGSGDELEAMLGRYYTEHGWDERGVPTAVRLEELGLTSIADRDLLRAAENRGQTREKVASTG